jgi:hypothetical protein
MAFLPLLVGCAVFANFFYSLRSESRRIWFLFASYSQVSVHSQTPFFASFESYSLQNIRTDSHTNTRFDAKNKCRCEYSLQSEYTLKILSKWRIFASKYSFRSEYSQNFKRISHPSEYSLANIRIQENILLQIFA